MAMFDSEQKGEQKSLFEKGAEGLDALTSPFDKSGDAIQAASKYQSMLNSMAFNKDLFQIGSGADPMGKIKGVSDSVEKVTKPLNYAKGVLEIGGGISDMVQAKNATSKQFEKGAQGSMTGVLDIAENALPFPLSKSLSFGRGLGEGGEKGFQKLGLVHFGENGEGRAETASEAGSGAGWWIHEKLKNTFIGDSWVNDAISLTGGTLASTGMAILGGITNAPSALWEKMNEHGKEQEKMFEKGQPKSMSEQAASMAKRHEFVEAHPEVAPFVDDQIGEAEKRHETAQKYPGLAPFVHDEIGEAEKRQAFQHDHPGLPVENMEGLETKHKMMEAHPQLASMTGMTDDIGEQEKRHAAAQKYPGLAPFVHDEIGEQEHQAKLKKALPWAHFAE